MHFNIKHDSTEMYAAPNKGYQKFKNDLSHVKIFSMPMSAVIFLQHIQGELLLQS